MPDLSRRAFLALAATVVVGACSDDDDAAPTDQHPRPDRRDADGPGAAADDIDRRRPRTTSTTTPRRRPPPLPADPFALGVTAGDPDATSVVLWTRLVGDALPDAVDVTWETSTDDFATVASSGTATATAADGHSVHAVVDVDGPVSLPLPAPAASPARSGAPRRPSSAPPALKVAAASCQHFETGFYAAHRDLAEWAPDAVVFLGDFIYEGAGRELGGEVVRVPRRAGADRPRRLPRPLRAVPRRPAPAGRRGRRARGG